MPTKLNQIVAVEANVKEGAATALRTATTYLGADAKAFTGIARTYVPLDPDDHAHAPERPVQRQMPQVVAEDVLERLGHELERLFDVTLTKEATDAQATADVVVTAPNGQSHVLVHDAPVTYLLFLEKQVNRLEQVFNALPLRDPGQTWEPDQGMEGVWRTPEGRRQHRTKVRHNWEKAPAVIQDGVGIPAQVEVFTDDDVVGHWNETHFSGAVSADRARQLRGKLAELKRAVISAREEANSITVTDREAGRDIFAWLLGD
jgi:hypothetical protein